MPKTGAKSTQIKGHTAYANFESEKTFTNDAAGDMSAYMATIKSNYREPEKILLIAVLEDALLMLYKHRFTKSFKNKKIFRETLEWINSVDGEYTISFSLICSVLDLDEDYLRKGILRYLERKASSVRSGLINTTVSATVQLL